MREKQYSIKSQTGADSNMLALLIMLLRRIFISIYKIYLKA